MDLTLSYFYSVTPLHEPGFLPIRGKPRSNPGQGDGMRRVSGAKVSSSDRLSPRLNLRRSTRVGAWKVMSLCEVRDKPTGQRHCHLPQLSAELSRLSFSVAAFSEVRRPGSGWGSGGGYTPTDPPRYTYYYYSGRPQGHLKGVAAAVADPLVPMITERKGLICFLTLRKVGD